MTSVLLKPLLKFWRPILGFSTPFILSPLIITSSNYDGIERGSLRTGYVILLMGIFWISEVIPVAVTALIPTVAFPLLGILSTNETSSAYMKSNTLMFMGGLIIAIAIENVKLHERCAVAILLKINMTRCKLILSMMLVTALLSMFLSNTATTALMIPITDAIIKQLILKDKREREDVNDEEVDVSQNTDLSLSKLNKRDKSFREICLLSIAYGANFGGTGSITGSPANLILPEALDRTAPGHSLTYASWMSFAVPVAFVNIILAWVQFIVFMKITDRMWNRKNRRSYDCINKDSKNDSPAVEINDVKDSQSNSELKSSKKANFNAELQQRYDALGPFTLGEKVVSIQLACLVLLWFTRDPNFIPGWGQLLQTTDISGNLVPIGDATSAMFVTLIVYLIPARKVKNKWKPIVDWSGIEGVGSRLPWGVIFLLGGGFALSDGCRASGLTKWLSGNLNFLSVHDEITSTLLISTIVSFVTELASNTATAAVLVPIFVEAAVKVGVNPVMWGLPATMSSSYAFMLPAATAPNSIVKQQCNISSIRMFMFGLVLHFTSVSITVLAIFTYGKLLF